MRRYLKWHAEKRISGNCRRCGTQGRHVHQGRGLGNGNRETSRTCSGKEGMQAHLLLLLLLLLLL